MGATRLRERLKGPISASPMRTTSCSRSASSASWRSPGCTASSCCQVGSNFTRMPADATPRFTRWLNGLSQAQLYEQQLVETTVIAPTWFCHRAVFESAGPFDEGGPGTPDDLTFFYRHLALGGLVSKVELPLVAYRFHSASVTGRRGVPWERIWAARVAHLEAHLLMRAPAWRGPFTIWNAGREGRRLFRSLSPQHRAQVAAFCDVDEKKIARGCYEHHESGTKVPVIHWSAAVPPLLLCVKRDLGGNDDFLAHLASLGLQEGRHYVHFS